MSVESLGAAIGARYDDVLVARGEIALVVERDALLDALTWLRDEPGVERIALAGKPDLGHPRDPGPRTRAHDRDAIGE